MQLRIAPLLAGIIFACLLLYGALCFRAFHRKPAIIFKSPIPDQAHKVILDWYENDYDIPTQSATKQTIWHALRHPLSPPREPFIVDGMEFISIFAYYDSHMVVFTETNGTWKFESSKDIWAGTEFEKPTRKNILLSRPRQKMFEGQ